MFSPRCNDSLQLTQPTGGERRRRWRQDSLTFGRDRIRHDCVFPALAICAQIAIVDVDDDESRASSVKAAAEDGIPSFMADGEEHHWNSEVVGKRRRVFTYARWLQCQMSSGCVGEGFK